MKRFGTLFACILLSATAVWAETDNATLTGTVHGSRGAVIPGAKVQVKSIATGVVKETATNSAGLYYVPNLIPGTYSIDVSATGFQPKQFAGVHLDVDQEAAVNVQLTVGSVTQQV